MECENKQSQGHSMSSNFLVDARTRAEAMDHRFVAITHVDLRSVPETGLKRSGAKQTFRTLLRPLSVYLTQGGDDPILFPA